MVLVKKVRKRGGPSGVGGPSRATSSLRPVLVEKEPPCAHACPCGTDVRGFLRVLAGGGRRGLTEAQAIEDAFYLIADRNPLPAVCGRLCPHHCETGCTREAYDGCVSVNQVERAIAEAAINASWPLRPIDDGRDNETASEPVTVIGAGAAGLSAAYQLARRGYDVTLVDPHDEAGGELRYGIGPERLPRAVLEAEVDRILALGVTFVGTANLAEFESAEPRVLKTKIYDDGTQVATGSIAASIHFGRHAAGLLDAGIRRAAAPDPPRLAPVAKDHVILDHFARVERGVATGAAWSAAEAVHEAQRCLQCGSCVECDNCWKYCPDQAVIRPLEPGGPYRFKLEFCRGCSQCAEQCPTTYIEMR
jgi:Pyruvate/2-oxoacid:ferredoxin oxidoreductase delta subunit